MKEEQIFERPQSQYCGFDHTQDDDPDDAPLGIHSMTATVIHVRPEDRDDDDIFDGVRPFSPGPWTGKSLTNGHCDDKHDHHEKVGDKDGPGIARYYTCMWTDANGHRDGVQEEKATEPYVVTDSYRLVKISTEQAAILHVEDEECSNFLFDHMFSPDKLAEEHRVGHDDQPQETKAKQMTTRHKSSIFISNHIQNNNSTTSQTSKPKKEAILARMLTNLQSPRPRTSRTGSLLHGILNSSSPRGRADTPTLEDENAQAMDLGQRKTRFAKSQPNGFAHGCHRSSGSPSSSVLPRQRATTGTPTYATYGTPFYGIENVDISSTRYRELHSWPDPNDLAERLSSKNENHSQNLNLNGKEKDSSSSDELRDHREHIWAIAHEYEYGPADSRGEGANGVPSAFKQGRYKRFSRLVPSHDETEHPILLSIMDESGVQTRAAGVGQQEQDEEQPPCDDPGAYIPILPENELGTAEDEVQSPPPTMSHTSPALAPVSQGIYGPDSFAESLQDSTVGQSQQEQERVKEDHRACLAKWKKWLFVLMALLVVVVVVVVLLLPKRVGRDAGGGDGGEQGGEDAYLENGQDSRDEGRHGAATKRSTSRVKPMATTKMVSSTGATATTTATTEKPSWGSTVPVPAATPTTSSTNYVPSYSATMGI